MTRYTRHDNKRYSIDYRAHSPAPDITVHKPDTYRGATTPAFVSLSSGNLTMDLVDDFATTLSQATAEAAAMNDALTVPQT